MHASWFLAFGRLDTCTSLPRDGGTIIISTSNPQINQSTSSKWPSQRWCMRVLIEDKLPSADLQSVSLDLHVELLQKSKPGLERGSSHGQPAGELMEWVWVLPYFFE